MFVSAVFLAQVETTAISKARQFWKLRFEVFVASGDASIGNASGCGLSSGQTRHECPSCVRTCASPSRCLCDLGQWQDSAEATELASQTNRQLRTSVGLVVRKVGRELRVVRGRFF